MWPGTELDTTEEKTSEFKDIEIEIFQNKTQCEKILKKTQSISELWNNIKQSNIHVITYRKTKGRGKQEKKEEVEKKYLRK